MKEQQTAEAKPEEQETKGIKAKELKPKVNPAALRWRRPARSRWMHHHMMQAPSWLLRLAVVCTVAASLLCSLAPRLRACAIAAGRSRCVQSAASVLGVAVSAGARSGSSRRRGRSRRSSKRRSRAPSGRSWPLVLVCLTILGFASCAAYQFAPALSPHGRKLGQVSVSSVSELTAAVRDGTVSKIVLAAGTYELDTDMCDGSAICIDRAVTIEAEVPGSVVLDAKGGRRVFNIEPGGTAELIGLNITGGYSFVCAWALNLP